MMATEAEIFANMAAAEAEFEAASKAATILWDGQTDRAIEKVLIDAQQDGCTTRFEMLDYCRECFGPVA